MSIAGLLTILVLIGCSIYVAALGRELHTRLTSSQLDGNWLLSQFYYLRKQGQLTTAQIRGYMLELDRPLSRILSGLLGTDDVTLDQGDYLISQLLDRERLKLEAGISGLGTVAVIAPFVGLFGTVVGITKTFADVAGAGKAGIEVVSAGVSEALVATAIGLLVAIVSVVLFNTFKNQFEHEITNWDVTARAMLSSLVATGESAPDLLDHESREISTQSAERYIASLETQEATD